MICFNGIFNQNNIEKTIKIYLDLNENKPYLTDLFIDNEKFSALINNNMCVINNTQYCLVINNFGDEIVVAAQEKTNFLHWICACMYSKKYFVVSNKDSIVP